MTYVASLAGIFELIFADLLFKLIFADSSSQPFPPPFFFGGGGGGLWKYRIRGVFSTEFARWGLHAGGGGGSPLVGLPWIPPCYA